MPVVLAIVFIYLGHFKNVYDDDDDDDEQNNQSTGPAHKPRLLSDANTPPETKTLLYVNSESHDDLCFVI